MMNTLSAHPGAGQIDMKSTQPTDDLRRHIPPEYLEIARQLGREHGVSHAIDPDDYIFWVIHDDMNRTDKSSSVREYFESGRNTATFLQSYLSALRLPEKAKYLDFASGYARVGRHLPSVMTNFDITLSDIHPSAIRFSRDIGLKALQSSTIPEEFKPQERFDVITAISFFTHMPQRTWSRWLNALKSALSPSGYIFFTTHGLSALAPMGVTQLSSSGFRFDPHTEQHDLDLADYGSTVSTFDFVYRKLLDEGLRLTLYKDAGMGYQDIYIVQSV